MAAGSLAVAVLGTSLTALGAWVAELGPALGPLIHRSVEVANFGRVGATSRDGLGMLELIARSSPDIVIVEFASNDSALHRHISLSESANNLAAITTELQAQGSCVYLMTMSLATGVRSVMRPRLYQYYDHYPALASKHRAGLIDNRPAWKTLSRASLRRAMPDGIHVSAEFALAITLANVLQTLSRDQRIDSRR